jgi:hypothetical protein
MPVPVLRPQPEPSPEQQLRDLWIARYGGLVAAQLHPDRRYSLVRVGRVEFAYTTYDRHVAALKQVWAAGLVPEPLPSVHGAGMLDVAPNLQGVDSDLSELRAGDTERRPRFS